MIKSHIKIEQCPNPEIRIYHVTEEASEVRRWSFGDRLLMSLDNDKHPGVTGKALADTFMALPGVKGGTLSKYEIRIEKSEAFDWEDIGPFIVGAIIKHLFPTTDGKTILISTKKFIEYFVRPDRWMEGDDGRRHREILPAERVETEVDLGSGRPTHDVEHLFDGGGNTKFEMLEQE